MEPEFFRYQGRLISSQSEEGKEIMKWDLPKSKGGMRPDTFQPYPRMLYMAHKRPDGIVSVGEPDDSIFGGQLGRAEQFNRTCQLIVNSEDEMRDAMSRGWRQTAKDALDRFEAKEREVGEAAAARHYSERSMSEKAQAEAAEADATSEEHVAEIPEKRRGRPRKVA